MNADRDRDRQLDDVLTRALRTVAAEPVTDACLDAETVAAWLDGGLDSQSITMAEAHASNCARCQALLGAVSRTTPAVAVAEPRTVRLWRWWFAPLAATAAAATVWMVVPRQPASIPAKETVVAVAEPQAATNPPVPAVPTAEASRDLRARREEAPGQPSAPALAERERANVAQPMTAPAELAKLADRQVAQALESTEQKAEAPKRADNAVEGRVAAAPPAAAARQQANALSDANISARSAPSPDVIWLVGRAGMVQLATDGRTFARVPFPETVDLIAVTATDERQATVTAADGRQFETVDAGRTWRLRR